MKSIMYNEQQTSFTTVATISLIARARGFKIREGVHRSDLNPKGNRLESTTEKCRVY